MQPPSPGDQYNDRHVLRLTSIEDVLAAVPYTLGYYPDNALVVLACGGPYRSRMFVSDLPLADASQVLTTAGRYEFTDVILVGYGPGHRVTPVIDAIRAQLAGSDVRLLEAVRAQGGRYWSYMCPSTGCHPPEGTPFDPAISPVSARAIVEGTVALASHDDLVKTLQPAGGTVRESMGRATIRAKQCIAGWSTDRLVSEGQTLVRSLAGTTIPDGAAPIPDDQAALLTVLLTNLCVRDEALAAIERDHDHLRDHITFWSDILRRAEPSCAAAPAALLAWTAWRHGDGVLARIALARALDADAGYTLTRLITLALCYGLHPDDIPQITLPDPPS